MYGSTHIRDCRGAATMRDRCRTGSNGNTITNTDTDTGAVSLRDLHTNADDAQPTARRRAARRWAPMKRLLLVLCLLCCATGAMAQTATPTWTVPAASPTPLSCNLSYELRVKALTPEAYWRLGEPTTTPVAESEVNSTTADGTYTSAPLQDQVGALQGPGDDDGAVAKQGGAYTADHVLMLNSAYLVETDTTMSVVGWFKSDDEPAQSRAWMYKSSSYQIQLLDSDSPTFGNIRCALTTGGGTFNLTSTRQNVPSGLGYGDSAWHFIVCVVSGTDFTMYVDGGTTFGGETVTTTISGDINDSGADLYVLMNGHGFNHWADEAAVFPDALTQQEVEDLYNAGARGCSTLTPTPTATPTVTHTPTPCATFSCCDCGPDQNCVDPEFYGVGWECPSYCTPIPQAACAPVP